MECLIDEVIGIANLQGRSEIKKIDADAPILFILRELGGITFGDP